MTTFLDSMHIDWTFLAIAIFLLWFPAPLFYTTEQKERLTSPLYSFHFNFLAYVGAWQNWVDGIRAFGGAYCLIHLAILENPAVENAQYYVLGAHAVVLGIAVLIQTIHYHLHVFFLSATFFLWAITLVLGGWMLGAYAIAAGALVGLMSNSPELKLCASAIVLGAFGYFMRGVDPAIAVNAGLLLLPVIIVFSFNQHLAGLTRAHSDIFLDEEEEESESENSGIPGPRKNEH